MQVLSHALDKTWIFLICNGIVVVIANTSSTVRYSQSGFDHLNDIKIGDNSLQPPLLDAKGNSLELPTEPDNINVVSGLEGSEEKENDATEEEQEERNPSLISVDYGEEATHAEQENEFIVKEGGGEKTPQLEISCIRGDNDEENHHEEESETCLMMMTEEEEEEEEEDQEQLYDYEEVEEEEEGMDKLSTEELNKKFEDFIRKMKEELRIQAQQQLILSC